MEAYGTGSPVEESVTFPDTEIFWAYAADVNNTAIRMQPVFLIESILINVWFALAKTLSMPKGYGTKIIATPSFTGNSYYYLLKPRCGS
jgi:hypothetical protein